MSKFGLRDTKEANTTPNNAMLARPKMHSRMDSIGDNVNLQIEIVGAYGSSSQIMACSNFFQLGLYTAALTISIYTPMLDTRPS